MSKQTIVLYPSPGIGHIISMVELGKLITKHHPTFTITIIITIPPFHTGSAAPYINHISKTNPSITFHYLPAISFSSIPIFNSIKEETFTYELLHLNKPHVHQALQTISASSMVSAFIMDMFGCSSAETASQLNIPIFYFFTSGVNILSQFLYLPTLDQNTTESFKDMNTLIEFPGMPLIPSSDMPNGTLDRTDKAYEWVIYYASQFPKSQGIIINSFESLERRVLKAVTDGLSIPDAPTPPIYCIGPLIASSDDRSGSGGEATHVPCLQWLDMQPSKSVVFLCFGSLGLFSKAQLKEIAIGLENSGQRFLWVVRSPPTSDSTEERLLAPPEPDLDALLPNGFLKRTKERGLVVKSWAPQVQVLSKKSVGGFVTHCGWNSVLEALNVGVPMVAWPQYAEQRLNKIIMVEELKIALPMDECEGKFVKAEEVEKKVRGLMESDEGSLIKERVLNLCDEAKAAISEDGSSIRNLAHFAQLWKS